MKKFIIEKEEYYKILDQHNKFKSVLIENYITKIGSSKSVISEQTDWRRTMIKNCSVLSGNTDVISFMDNFSNLGNTIKVKLNQKVLDLIQSPINPIFKLDDTLFIYLDVKSQSFKYALYRTENGNFTEIGVGGNWSCGAVETEKKTISDISSTQMKTVGWITIEQIREKENQGIYPINFSDPNSYRTETKNGITYYQAKRLIKSCPMGPVDQEEKERVDEFTGRTDFSGATINWKFCGQLDAAKRDNKNLYKSFKLNDTVTDFRPDGITLYAPIKELFGKSQIKTLGSRQASPSVSENQCKDLIKNYWTEYKNSAFTEGVPDEYSKSVVQSCMRYYPFGGGIFSNIDEILQVLMRTKADFKGTPMPGRNSQWSIKPKEYLYQKTQ